MKQFYFDLDHDNYNTLDCYKMLKEINPNLKINFLYTLAS